MTVSPSNAIVDLGGGAQHLHYLALSSRLPDSFRLYNHPIPDIALCHQNLLLTPTRFDLRTTGRLLRAQFQGRLS